MKDSTEIHLYNSQIQGAVQQLFNYKYKHGKWTTIRGKTSHTLV